MINKKAQTWSLDTVIAVFIFISAISAFIIIISTDLDENTVERLKDDAKILPQALFSQSASEFAIVEGNKINLAWLNRTQAEEYKYIKSELGIKSDFCVYFEDADGNLINISGLTGTDRGVGIGSRDIELSDTIACSK